MKKFIKLFEEHVNDSDFTPEETKPEENDNYAMGTAQDFHISEIMGDIDEELNKKFGSDEAKKDKIRKSIANVWIFAVRGWADKGKLPAMGNEAKHFKDLGIDEVFNNLNMTMEKDLGSESPAKAKARRQISLLWQGSLMRWAAGDY